jgi:GNAT superfamily N-acetyltransferase
MTDILRSIRKSTIFKWLVILALSLSLVFYAGFYFMPYRSAIHHYDDNVDRRFLFDVFKSNWYWLVAGNSSFNEEYVKNIVDHKAPTRSVKDRGRLNILTYRVSGRTVAFTAFYKKSFYKGFILFLAVDQNYRGRGYGKKLLQSAIDQLKKDGTCVIELVTRKENTSAIALYERMGFVQTKKTDKDTYVWFKKEMR